MDIQEVLRKKIEALPVGAHADGLRAVITHIEAAVRHYTRGQQQSDETLFTDVIFRCNQAFEGSIKEAYRALAGKDPKKKTPAEIEKFLASSNLLRAKVLEQFTRYRQEWRNPSTHDYTLDFDQDEALIAIVSVTVFAIVLCDQIDGKIAFDAAAAATPSTSEGAPAGEPLLDIIQNVLMKFAAQSIDLSPAAATASQDYLRLEGAAAGHLSAELSATPGVSVVQDAALSPNVRADILVSRGNERVAVELKWLQRTSDIRFVRARVMAQGAFYLNNNALSGVIALLYSPNERRYTATDHGGEMFNGKFRLIAPPIG